MEFILGWRALGLVGSLAGALSESSMVWFSWSLRSPKMFGTNSSIFELAVVPILFETELDDRTISALQIFDE